MTTLQQTIIILFICISTGLCSQTKGKVVVLGSTLKRMQGVWTSDKDSLSTVQIVKDNWVFKYDNKALPDDQYKITLRDTIFGKSSISSKVLTLTNSRDTLEYEIMNSTPTILSLMYLTNGRLHLYKKLTK
jgi:hypothetical protein